MSEVNTIGRDFTLPELVKFVAPPILTRLFVSLLQTLDDSLFVSRFCGPNALAAFSVAMPWFMLIDSIGMLTGAISIVCSIKLGEKKQEEAKSDFTTMCLVVFGIGLVFTGILLFFLKDILILLGETEVLLPHAMAFMKVSRFYIPLLLVSYILNSFYIIAGKPKWSMYSSAVNTFCQLFFDWLFIVKLNTGIVGCAYANLIGNLLVTAMALVFYSNKEREIHFVAPRSEVWPLVKTVFKYGRVQFVTSLAISLSSYISNQIHLSLGGETIVAAYTIASNVCFMFMNSFFGLVSSVSPIFGYAYGEKNQAKIAKVCRQSVILVSILILILITILIGGKELFLSLYLSEGSSETIRELARKGLGIYPFSFLFGYNVLVQEFSNVAGRHKASVFLSITENVILQNLCVLILPRIFGLGGVWFVFLTAEFLTFFFTVYVVYRNRDVFMEGMAASA